MPERNIELLEKTMQHILDHPEQHNQGIWVGETTECGTTACFAGWACFLSDRATHERTAVFQINGRKYATRDAAMKLLGLTAAESWILFNGFNTVEDLQLMVKTLINGEEISKHEHSEIS